MQRHTADDRVTPNDSAIVQLKLEAEMRNLSMGQLLAEVASMAIKKGMIEEILHEPTQERAAPLQPENS